MDVRLGPLLRCPPALGGASSCGSPRRRAVRRYTTASATRPTWSRSPARIASCEVVGRERGRDAAGRPVRAAVEPRRAARPVRAGRLPATRRRSCRADPRWRRWPRRYRPADPADTLRRRPALMELVYREFTYEQHVTDVATTVERGARGGRGVCQDFAHVLIGLCRAIEIPARYVSGYIVGRARRVRRAAAAAPAPRTPGSRRTRRPTAGAASTRPTTWWPTTTTSRWPSAATTATSRPTRGSYRGATEEKLTVVVSARRID